MVKFAYSFMGEPALKYSEKYTVENWEHWTDRWELIHGFPYCMTPQPDLWHQEINLKIAAEFLQKFANCKNCKVYIPIDWQIDEETVVQPDVSVICKIAGGKRIYLPPNAIFEILSPSTEKKDRIVKFDLYQVNGVEYFVIVNPKNKSFEVYKLINKKYELQEVESSFQFDFDGCLVDFDFSKIW